MSLEDICMNTQDLSEKRKLDAGGFGTIFLCHHEKYGDVVLKKVYTGPERTNYKASLLEEGSIMYRLQHERVVKLLGIILEDGNYSLVMEYVQRGNMMKVLQKLPLPLSVKGRFVMEIIEGMLYLHKKGFVHKDLKPENILVDTDFHIKIADFGFASYKSWSHLSREETGRRKQINSICHYSGGTLSYMAPEHLSTIHIKPGEKSDVYSFGIVMWAIFANKEPYEHSINDSQIRFVVKDGKRPNIEEITDKCPVEIIDLMEQCWKQESEKRPTFAEISQKYSPFYCQNLENNIGADLEKLKKMWPVSDELLDEMQSLQIDAVAENRSNAQADQPDSLHSIQGPMTSQVNEALSAASPENQPVESCETPFTSADNLNRKLQREYNYHAYGSWMDKAVLPVVYTPEMREEERRRVSYDPLAKPSPIPQWSELHPRAEKTTVNTNPYIWPAAITPKQGTVDTFHGINPKGILMGNTDATYGLCSASTFNLGTPVPESDQNSQSQTNVNWYPKNTDKDTGNTDSTPFIRQIFRHSSVPRASREDSVKYNISYSSGIQIGSYNHMKIEEPGQNVSTYPGATEESYRYYKKNGVFDNESAVTDEHLNLVKEKLAKQWKECARKLDFCEPDIDEIDYDYDRYGLKEKVYQMLLKWVMREGAKGATFGKLAKALYDCQRPDLLNSLMQIKKKEN
ncbi:receptor-interacting serine/threonine-protein kinase 1 [Pezoporus flaviventris]|uniref:receptor-interacting serine/threonine-protein kinase 1 n=1 Tax=Pezoporus flaviventris TaxID=889875 RepID=UPI002AAF4662|nr:receptor-interacting serine/threonine-protein kinase 1 [Pezoporus flaviventris]